MRGFPSVMAGPDPAIQPLKTNVVHVALDGRVKPGHESGVLP